MRLLWVLLLAVLATSEVSGADEYSSEMAEILSGNFVVERNQGVKYRVTYSLRDPAQEDLIGRIHFQNPADRSEYITVDVPVSRGSELIEAESPLMSCINGGRKYKFSLELIRNDEVIDTLEQSMRFSMPSNYLKQLGVSRC